MLVVDIWRNQPGAYFCISTKTRGGHWDDKYFARCELGKVADYIRDYRDRNVYWCPHGLSRKRRRKEDAVLPTLLWADIDGGVDPDDLGKLRPTVCIESSPGRYVGIWECDGVVSEELNRRLSYAIGADKSGWDLTQVLRAPGTINYNYASLPRARLLWSTGREHRVSELQRLLPHIEESKADTGGGGDIDRDAVSKLDGAELTKKYRVTLPFRKYVILKKNGDVDNSETLMAHAGFARKAGATDEEIAAMLRDMSPSFQEKYGRVLNDRAWAEIERVCSKLEKRK